MRLMIRQILLNNRIETFLVSEEESIDLDFFGTLMETLQVQAEQIKVLENRNRGLIEQEKELMKLLGLSTETGRLMSQNIRDFNVVATSREHEDGDDPIPENN